MTGGTGRLGSEVVPLLARAAEVHAPGRSRLDVTDAAAFATAAKEFQPDLILHAAAYTDVAGAEQARDDCWLVNVGGTRNAAEAALACGAKLVHVSTDYVFWGDVGGYPEDATPGPVRNYYALTKLVAEEAARGAGELLILRTSFRPREWPYPKAFTDLYTSQDYVDVIAPQVVEVVLSAPRIDHEILHVATERKSVFDLARRRSPDVQPASKSEAPVALPDDVSLDVTRWRTLRAQWEARGQEA